MVQLLRAGQGQPVIECYASCILNFNKSLHLTLIRFEFQRVLPTINDKPTFLAQASIIHLVFRYHPHPYFNSYHFDANVLQAIA